MWSCAWVEKYSSFIDVLNVLRILKWPRCVIVVSSNCWKCSLCLVFLSANDCVLKRWTSLPPFWGDVCLVPWSLETVVKFCAWGTKNDYVHIIQTECNMFTPNFSELFANWFFPPTAALARILAIFENSDLYKGTLCNFCPKL